MACVVDTPSVNLTVTGGTLSADAIIDPGAVVPNLLTIQAGGLYVYTADGWVPLNATLAYSSATPPIYAATTSADLTAWIGPGTKMRLVQSGVTRYFEVVQINAATIWFYGGDQQVLANLPITSPSYSQAPKPVGYPALTVSTTMPSVRYDGMLVTLIADATAGIEWVFRFRAASASAYPWEFVGGAPLRSTIDTGETCSSATYTNLATNGPAIAAPRPGEYECIFGVEAVLAATTNAFAAIAIDGVSATDATRIAFTNLVATPTLVASSSRAVPIAVLAAGDIVKIQYRGNSATTQTFEFRWIWLRPLRVG